MSSIPFIGRDLELQSLKDLFKKKTSSLVVIKGRRRIGKTRLIEEFAKDQPFLRFIGLAPAAGMKAETQRNEFSRLLSQQTKLPEIKTEDWSTLFALLAEKVKKGRHIILFDEITWMADDDPSFLSKLKNAWELLYQKNPKLILILCGSISSWIEKNILSSTGYFGRISKKITLHELSLSQSNQLLNVMGFKRSSYEKFLFLALTGGIPWYIELINPSFSANDNIQTLCFDSDGLFVSEHKHIFHDLFGNRGAIYEKITTFLAHKTAQYAEIADGIHYSSSGLLSDYLDELIESGYVTRSFSWELLTGREKKISLYRLSDNYLRFYYKYIQPKLSLIKKDQYRGRLISSLPGWNTVMGFQFESLVLKNRKLIQDALKISPEDIIADDIYYQRETKQLAGCQVDYLIHTRMNTLFVCEIKFSQHELKTTVIAEVKDKIRKLAVPRNFVCLPVLIHINGVSEAVSEAEYFFEIINFSSFLDDEKR